jgi:hypothetical protein
MEEIKWRFPGNNYTDESGLDTPDMETFKRDPIASLAREVCQNSIDARLDFSKPVVVDFKMFMLQNKDIPGIERLGQEISNCKVEWKEHDKISRQLKEMEVTIDESIIDCLRISDFNTTGLTGIETNEKKAWYLLTKGSGISKKGGTSGGSKGIGKFASFVASKFNTVFYATRTTDNEVGYQGISKLCSASMPNTDEKTQGIGYYGLNEKNNPILDELNLDPYFHRKSSETGTDIYILGFRSSSNWKRDVISKILDSFMAAIIFDSLIVNVGDTEVSAKNLEEIINNDELISKNAYKSIKSQFLLLTSEDTYQEPISIGSYGDAILYVKSFSKEELQFATNSCVMIRFPYMKIKTLNKVTNIPSAAMCIINDNRLNEILRDIENPQHTDWEINRIHDSTQKKEIRSIITELNKKIQDIISDYLITSDDSKTDVEGASDFLPDNVNTGEELASTTDIIEKINLIKTIRNKNRSVIGVKEDESTEAMEPDVGGPGGEGDDVPDPEGENDGSGRDSIDRPESTGLIEGESDIMRFNKLSGMKYNFFVIDKNQGIYSLVFTAPFDEQNCYLELNFVDESGSKSPVKILDAKLNQAKCIIDDERKVHFPLFSGKKNKFIIKTNQTELFSSEVSIYANR